MKFPVLSTDAHQGKTLEIDCDRETLTLLGHQGESLGSLTWAWVIDRILSNNEVDAFAHCRAYPRAPLAIKVACETEDGHRFESLTGGIGGGGLFIESSSPLAPGSELVLEFSLPDSPGRTISAKAKVVWRRHKVERLLMFPGMGLQFTDIRDEARDQIVTLVEALNRGRQPNPPQTQPAPPTV
ncbi:hypothetical protein YTPLAS18_01560 [Nitrospira sp.]|nr:hypothetical protein YTPLAS18_01560 [Nitrospira sp.]